MTNQTSEYFSAPIIFTDTEGKIEIADLINRLMKIRKERYQTVLIKEIPIGTELATCLIANPTKEVK